MPEVYLRCLGTTIQPHRLSRYGLDLKIGLQCHDIAQSSSGAPQVLDVSKQGAQASLISQADALERQQKVSALVSGASCASWPFWVSCAACSRQTGDRQKYLRSSQNGTHSLITWSSVAQCLRAKRKAKSKVKSKAKSKVQTGVKRRHQPCDVQTLDKRQVRQALTTMTATRIARVRGSSQRTLRGCLRLASGKHTRSQRMPPPRTPRC